MLKVEGPKAGFYKDLLTMKSMRLNRADYAAFFFILKAVGDLVEFLAFPNIVTMAFAAIFIWIGVAIVRARLHDIGMSGWWSILIFGLMISSIFLLKMMSETGQGHPSYLLAAVIPVLGAAFFLFLKPGQKEANKYGEPYRGSQAIGWVPAKK